MFPYSMFCVEGSSEAGSGRGHIGRVPGLVQHNQYHSHENTGRKKDKNYFCAFCKSGRAHASNNLLLKIYRYSGLDRASISKLSVV